MDKINLSVIVPVYNEARNIELLYNSLIQVLGSYASYEIIYVDDGSTDSTSSKIKGLIRIDKGVKLISFRRNFGKSSALSAGFKAAKSDLILTMDGDLQDDPKEIPKFLQAIKSVDLVVGWKYKRKDIITRRISSKIFNFLVRLFTGIKLHDSDCNFRIMRKEVIESFNLYSGMYRYIPSLAHSNGFKIKEVKVIHHKRRFGNSKFGTGRLITGSLDLLTIVFLTSFSKRPLHLLGVLGGVTLFFGLFAGSYLLFIKYFLFQPISGRPLLILALLFIVLGVQLVSLGLLAELITNLIQRNEDDYIIKEEL